MFEDSNFLLLQKTLQGDAEATRKYCGSYKLVMVTDTSGMYRTKELRAAHTEIKQYAGHSVYDEDGFLLPIFWSLPRI